MRDKAGSVLGQPAAITGNVRAGARSTLLRPLHLPAIAGLGAVIQPDRSSGGNPLTRWPHSQGYMEDKASGSLDQATAPMGLARIENEDGPGRIARSAVGSLNHKCLRWTGPLITGNIP